jgi:hypothetical protein
VALDSRDASSEELILRVVDPDELELVDVSGEVVDPLELPVRDAEMLKLLVDAYEEVSLALVALGGETDPFEVEIDVLSLVVPVAVGETVNSLLEGDPFEPD